MGSSPVRKSVGLCVEVLLFFIERAFNEVRRRANIELFFARAS